MGKYSVTAYNLAPLQPLNYQPTFTTEQPRAVAVINGTNYQILSYEIEGNAHGATDSAIIDLTLSNGPDWTIELYRDQNQDDPVYVEIWAGYPPNTGPSTSTAGLQQRFVGIVDQYSLQIDGDTGTFRCRSLAAPLVDREITTLAQNMTSVQFVQYWAAQYGLTPVINLVNAPVTLQQVWANEFVAGIKKFRIWDVILKCAVFDGVDAWVSGSNLYYAAPSLVQRTLLDLQYGRDLTACNLVHSPQFSKNVKVEVHSYQPHTRVAVSHRITTDALGGVTETTTSRTVTSSPIFGTTSSVTTTTSPTGTVSTVSSSSGGSSSSSTSEGTEGQQPYIYYVANLTPQQCINLARAIWQDISMAEYIVTAKLPMTKSKLAQFSGVTALVRLHGTPYLLAESSSTQNGASNPQVATKANDYWPRRYTEEFDGAGWTLDLEMVNHTLPQGAV